MTECRFTINFAYVLNPGGTWQLRICLFKVFQRVNRQSVQELFIPVSLPFQGSY
jgi:hypothetical protein